MTWLKRRQKAAMAAVARKNDISGLYFRFMTGKAPARECGGCVECCRVFAIKEMGKPPGCDCEHQCAAGCGIYATRPAECGNYLCLWRVGWGTEDDRPDKSGVLLSINTSSIGPTPKNNMVLGVDPVSLDIYELREGAGRARFPNGSPLELIPDDGTAHITVYPYGVPRASDGPYAERYRDHAPPEGQNSLTRSGPVLVQLGIMDREGRLHSRFGAHTPTELEEAARADNDPESARLARGLAQLAQQRRTE